MNAGYFFASRLEFHDFRRYGGDRLGARMGILDLE
jgi:hypothetical protein